MSTANRLFFLCLILLLLTGCGTTREPAATPRPEPTSPAEPAAGLPNPASQFCAEQGFTLEMRTDEEGGTFGVCIFPDGSECEEWAFFRGECGPGGSSWGTTTLTLSILESFPVQVRAQLAGTLPDTCARIDRVEQSYDAATQTFELLPVVGSIAGTECLPQAIPFTAGVDLDVLGLSAGTYDVAVGAIRETFTLSTDNRLPDEGTGPAAVADADDWPMLTNPAFGFSVRFPPDWVATETVDPIHTLSGHQIQLTDPDNPEILLSIAYKFNDDDMRLVRSGMREGEFVPAGTVPFLDEPVEKSLLVFDGKTMGVYYDGAREVGRGPLIFTLALDYLGDSQRGSGISAADELLADLIVMSITLDQ